MRLGADIEAGQSGAEIEAAVESVGAAIELVDLGEAGDDAGAILAAGIFHRAVLLGDLAPLDPVTSLADLRSTSVPAVVSARTDLPASEGA